MKYKNLGKFSLIFLASCSSLERNPAEARYSNLSTDGNNWSQVNFGRIPLSSDFTLSGELQSRRLFTEKLNFKFTIAEEPFQKHEVNDIFNFEQEKHLISYEINGIKCTGATVLTTEDEMGEKISYSAIVTFDGNAQLRSQGCPYLLQIYLGEGEEMSKQFGAEVVLYPTNNLREEKIFKGILKKYLPY